MIYKNEQNNKYIKSKVKTFNDLLHTNFHSKKITKENMHYVTSAIIAIDYEDR